MQVCFYAESSYSIHKGLYNVIALVRETKWPVKVIEYFALKLQQ